MKKRKFIIVLLSAIFLFSVVSFVIYKKSAATFKGEEAVLNETLATLKEGESIELKHKDSSTSVKTDVFFKGNQLAHLENIDLTVENSKVIYLESFSQDIDSKKGIEKHLKQNRYLYEYNLESNEFTKKFKLKNYPVTAIETEKNNYYIAYFNAEKIKEKVVIDDSINEYGESSHFLSKKTCSEISNIGTGVNVSIKNRYVYNIVAKNNKIYAIVSQEINDKRPLHYVYYDSNDEFSAQDKPKDVFIYNQDLEKIGEMKKGKKDFIEKNFKDWDNSNNTYIEKNNLGLHFIEDENYDYDNPNSELGQLIQYKNNEKVKKQSVNFFPSIDYLNEVIYYSDEKHFILNGTFYKESTEDFETKLLKINLETLGWEPFLEPEKPDESLLFKD